MHQLGTVVVGVLLAGAITQGNPQGKPVPPQRSPRYFVIPQVGGAIVNPEAYVLELRIAQLEASRRQVLKTVGPNGQKLHNLDSEIEALRQQLRGIQPNFIPPTLHRPGMMHPYLHYPLPKGWSPQWPYITTPVLPGGRLVAPSSPDIGIVPKK